MSKLVFGSRRFKEICEERGVEIIVRSNGHVQLKGPLLVNYYPFSDKQSAYVAGTVKSRTFVSPEDAIEMCFEVPEKVNGKKDNRKSGFANRRAKKRMLKKDPHCVWCKTPLTMETATLEHIIPLDKGGLDNANNHGLACAECNHKRGNDMPELKESE